MKSSFKWIILAMSLGLWCFAYFDRPEFMAIVASITHNDPCQKPIEYSLGTFDSRFGISKAAFLNDATKAEKIWEDAAGRQLFTNTQKGGLKINLIYDDRQAATEKLKSIGLTINTDKATFDSLKLKYDAETKSFKEAKASLEAEVANVKADKDAYEAQVAYWNGRGGAPKAEYQQLEIQKNNVNAEIENLNSKQKALNDTADTINSLATVINQLINELNLNVSKYNSTSSSTGESFDEGLYISDSNGQRIEIYQYADESKLVRVLAHELGHALGMDHVNDPKAIMYKLNQSTNSKPTPEDISELNKACKIAK